MKYRIHGGNEIGIHGSASVTQNRISTYNIAIKNIFKYAFRNATYRSLIFQLNIDQMKELYVHFPACFSTEAMSFLRIDQTNYIIRKYNNIFQPYRVEKRFIEQLVYIICF
jgi:hypothetical protein